METRYSPTHNFHQDIGTHQPNGTHHLQDFSSGAFLSAAVTTTIQSLERWDATARDSPRSFGKDFVGRIFKPWIAQYHRKMAIDILDILDHLRCFRG